MTRARYPVRNRHLALRQEPDIEPQVRSQVVLSFFPQPSLDRAIRREGVFIQSFCNVTVPGAMSAAATAVSKAYDTP